MKNIWVIKSTNKIRASVIENLRLAMTVIAKNDWAAVSRISSACLESRGMGFQWPAERLYTMGNMPIKRVHWLTLDATRVLKLFAPWALRAKRMATINSGDSLASGANH